MFYYGSFVFVARRDQPKSAENRRNIFFFFGQAIVTGGQGQETICHREAVKTLVEVIKRKCCLSTEPASTI